MRSNNLADNYCNASEVELIVARSTTNRMAKYRAFIDPQAAVNHIAYLCMLELDKDTLYERLSSIKTFDNMEELEDAIKLDRRTKTIEFRNEVIVGLIMLIFMILMIIKDP